MKGFGISEIIESEDENFFYYTYTIQTESGKKQIKESISKIDPTIEFSKLLSKKIKFYK